MANFFLISVVYILGGMFIGIPMGMKSLSVWTNWQRESRFWKLVLFPILSSESEVRSATKGTFGIQVYYDGGSKATYLGMTAMFWAPRILLNILSISIMAMFYVVGYVLVFFLENLPIFFGKLIRTR